ncbi:PGF-pre-PGF domain-containing protein [Candidatus Micrarchaeum sp.]|uniref:PGF-pre-PGF domain-containing protein n=1 Tax=Candidatus Micrarchaeum sp. TaxID=2282148 RepID=UPI0019320F5D|nr:PGF-pre-PGF domain-containing protein [Candidatus Micrarchaeum sp.]
MAVVLLVSMAYIETAFAASSQILYGNVITSNGISKTAATTRGITNIGITSAQGYGLKSKLVGSLTSILNKLSPKVKNRRLLISAASNLEYYNIASRGIGYNKSINISIAYPKNITAFISNNLINISIANLIIKQNLSSMQNEHRLSSKVNYVPKGLKTPILINGSTSLINLTVKLNYNYTNTHTVVAITHTPPNNTKPMPRSAAYYFHVNSTISDTHVQNANYTFAVNRSWIIENNISEGQVSLYKYVKGSWVQMPTIMIGNNSTAYFYDGRSDSLSTYAISYSTGSVTSSANPLSLTLPTGYNLYLCAAGANYTFAKRSPISWVALQNASGPSSPPAAASIGYQTSNICKASVPTKKRNDYYLGLAIAGMGLNLTHYSFYGAAANSSAATTLNYPVNVNGSFVTILVASGYYGLSGLPTIPNTCITQQITTNSTSYESAYIATCKDAAPGNYTVSASNGNFGATTIEAFVFQPGNVIFYDNPQGAGYVSANNKTYSNGQSALLLGRGEISAIPKTNFVFTNWTVSSANLSIANVYAQTTNLTVMGNGAITASYNGITKFEESGLPSGATWSAVYDGITNTTTGNMVSFDTVPGNHAFAIENVTYNGNTYIPKPSSGSLVAGNVTSVAFSEEGILSLVIQSNKTAYDTSDLVTATAPLPTQDIEILIGKGSLPGVEVADGIGSASCNLYSTCNANAPLGAGIYNVSAEVTSTGNVISKSVNITRAIPKLSLSVPNSYVYDGNGGAVTFNISTYNNQLEGLLNVNNATVASTYSTNTYTTSSSVGNYSALFYDNGNNNYTSVSKSGSFSILPKLYTVNFTENASTGTTGTLSVSAPSGYNLYLCDGGAGNAGITYSTGTTDASDTYSYIGHQTANTCTETTTGPDLTEGIIGIKASPTYSLATSTGTATDSLTYNVTKNDSFVAIMISSGYFGLSSAPVIPSGCTEKAYITGGDTYESAYIAICQSQIKGQYSISASSSSGGYITIGAYVFPPYSLTLDDNPAAGTITTDGKTFSNGETTNVIGTGTITANPPNNFVFTNWTISSANLSIANVYAQTTNLTVMGNGAITASYNGITKFEESGLPSGATWSAVYDGITNTTTGNMVSFDTVPGNHAFAIENVTYNGNTYIPKPSSGSLVAGNVTSVAFSEEGILSLVIQSNKTAYDTSDLVTATAPLPTQDIEILIGKGSLPGVEVADGIGSASCNLYSTCNANAPLGAGIYNVSAEVTSTGNVISKSVNITRAIPKLSLSVPNSYVYDGNGGAVTFNISTYNNQLEGLLNVNNATVASTYSTNTYTTSSSVGNYSALFYDNGNNNYTSVSKSGSFSILPKLYTVNFTENASTGTTGTLSVSAPSGYNLYLCDGGAGNAGITYSTGTTDASDTYSYIGHQTANTCTETTTGPDLTEGIIGIKASPTYSLATSTGTATDSLTYNVTKNDSFVAIMISSGYFGLSSAPVIPSGCTEKAYITGGDTYESAYIAICQSQIKGQYSISASSSSGGYITIGAYVFPPYSLTLDDNPAAGTITTDGKTFSNGETTNVIGTGTITANPPNNFVFTNWTISSANLSIANVYAQTTNLTVMGNGAITASYNGITKFEESGLPAGTVWNITYDSIRNSSNGNMISFDTVPGSHAFSVGNVMINGYNYTPTTYSGSVVAGNTTSIIFKPPICTISLSSNSVSFGSLGPDSTYPDNVMVTDYNKGSAEAHVFVSGTNWTYGSNNAFGFGVSNTTWSSSALAIYGGKVLEKTAFNTSIAVLQNGSSPVYFGLSVPGAIPAGTYTQRITITNSC